MATHTAPALATPQTVLDGLDQFCRGGLDTSLIMASVARSDTCVDVVSAPIPYRPPEGMTWWQHLTEELKWKPLKRQR